jgi:hypothetical protein
LQLIGFGVPANYKAGTVEPVVAMKIFPPLTEMLWPPGSSLMDVIRSRRYPLLAVVSLIAVWGAWPSAGVSNVATRSHLTSPTNNVASANPACSSLIVDRSTSVTKELTCSDPDLQPGRSLATNAALQRASMPPRSNTLTASDLAIVAPTPLRKSVFDEGGAATYAIEKPALAWSPNPN